MTVRRHIFYEFSGYVPDEGGAPRTDPEGLGLSQADLVALDQYSRRIAEDGVFQIGPNCIMARQYAGVVVFGDRQFEIVPKILKVREEERGGILKNLLWMLQVAPDVWPLRTDDATLAVSRGSFLDLAIYQYAKTVCRAVDQGVPQLYVDREDNLARPKGRIDFRENIRLNSWNEARLACRYSEITYDHVLLRAVRYVLRVFHRLAQDSSVRLAVAEALSRTNEVSDRQVAYIEVERLPVPQSNPAFVSAVETAKLVLRGLRVEATGGNQNGMAFVFDMNELFERYFAAVLVRYKTQLGLADVYVQKRRVLVERIVDVAANAPVSGGMVTFTDIFVRTLAGRCIVLDTKYKLAGGDHQFHAGVSNADAYQVLAYQGIYTDGAAVPDGVLIYPESYRPVFLKFEVRGGKRFFMKTISLTRDLATDEVGLVKDLQRFFEALGGAENCIEKKDVRAA